MNNAVMANGGTYEEMRSIAERIRELGIEPSVLTRLYSDHLARQGYDPRKLRVSEPGATYNYRGLYYPETTETGAPMPQERMDTSLSAMKMDPILAAIQRGEKFTPGDTLLALSPGESINDRIDTVLHEARHRGDSARGNWVPGMQQGSGAEEAVVRYLDVMYGSERAKRDSGQWLLQKGYDPLSPPPQIAPYLAETLQATGRFAESNPLDRAIGTPAMTELLARNPNAGYQGEAPNAPYRPATPDSGASRYSMVQPAPQAPTYESVQGFFDSLGARAPGVQLPAPGAQSPVPSALAPVPAPSAQSPVPSARAMAEAPYSREKIGSSVAVAAPIGATPYQGGVLSAPGATVVPTVRAPEVIQAREPAPAPAPRAESPEPSPYTSPLDAPVRHVETKGGSYPVYQKDSAPAQSFRSAYAEAKGAGAKDFTWQDRSYNTK